MSIRGIFKFQIGFGACGSARYPLYLPINRPFNFFYFLADVFGQVSYFIVLVIKTIALVVDIISMVPGGFGIGNIAQLIGKFQISRSQWAAGSMFGISREINYCIFKGTNSI